MSIKLLTIGDPHYSGTAPKAYKGNHKEDILTHLKECREIIHKLNCEAVLMPGDLFNSHIISMSVLSELITVLKSFPCPILTVAGNHDRQTTNFQDIKSSPYGLLWLAEVIGDVYLEPYANGALMITGHPYTEETDKNMLQYTGPHYQQEGKVHIHLTHGMLLPETPWWAEKGSVRVTTFDQLTETPKEKRPHIIVNGHYHDGHHAQFIDEKTMVVNYGAVCRLTRGVNEINRTLQVGLITIESPEKYWAEPITLESQRPGHEVLDREELVREVERSKNREKMSQYLEMLGTKREIQVRDARAVIKDTVKELNIPEPVKERCFARLDNVAEQLEGEWCGR